MGFTILHQSFSLLDIPRVLVVILLECVLSADNAIALAIIVKQLPDNKKSKALWIGSISALFLRAIGLIFASFFIQYFWVQILGACYLLYLACTFYLRSKKQQEQKSAKEKPFWKVVLEIELTDFVFAIDSIVAALGLISLQVPKGYSFPPNLWIVYIGGVVGILIMRTAARAFAKLMDKFKRLELSAHLLIGWIGLKLAFEAVKAYLDRQMLTKASLYTLNGIEYLFWAGIIAFIVFALIPKSSKRFK